MTEKKAITLHERFLRLSDIDFWNIYDNSPWTPEGFIQKNPGPQR